LSPRRSTASRIAAYRRRGLSVDAASVNTLRKSMEELERSEFTVAGKIANERLAEAALDHDRYPEGATLIASDQEGFAVAVAEVVSEHRPLAIVYPDGREIVAAPRSGALGLLEYWVSRRRSVKSQGVLSVPLPADYRVEFREPPPA
jgi:hypothetical protein